MRAHRVPALLLLTIALASASAACSDAMPPGLQPDGGGIIDLGDAPDLASMDAAVHDMESRDASQSYYCGRVGNITELALFPLQKTRFADVVASPSTLDAIYVTTRDEEGDVVARRAFSLSDGTPSSDERVISVPSFGTMFAPSAASTPFGGLLSYDSYANGSVRTTTIRRMGVDGAPDGEEEVVSDPSFPSLRSRVAPLLGGGFALAWTEAELVTLGDGAPAYVDTRLRYLHIDENGMHGMPVVIPTDAPIRSFTLAKGSSESALVYVLDRSAEDGHAQSIYVRPITENGGLAVSALALAIDHTIVDEVSAIRVTDNTVVAWTEVTASLRSDVHMQRITDDGTLAVERVVTQGREQGGSPALSLFGAFHLGLVYVGGPAGTHELRFLELEIDALPTEPAITIADIDMSAPANIALGLSEDRTALGVAWTQTTSAGNRSHFAVVSCNVAGEPTDGGWCEPDGGM